MKNDKHPLAGIDYGSKMAGTTVIATLDVGGQVQFAASQAKKDADAFVRQHFSERPPHAIFIDAPLSLPAKYRRVPGYDDYFYRQADRALKAMSPMFLGGLTARAMRLREQLEDQGHQLYEVYPGGLARHLELDQLAYKKKKSDLAPFLAHLAQILPLSFRAQDLPNWHHVDALLALYCGYRFQADQHQSYGDPAEGQIFI